MLIRCVGPYMVILQKPTFEWYMTRSEGPTIKKTCVAMRSRPRLCAHNIGMVISSINSTIRTCNKVCYN